ncbi:hypothetical protein LC608_35055 [Nostoc sp. XA010]|uniref:hypothetical protein n=1 Tax=Nostoc sp. XA010 TaxID=2780407 RepID=UPI001E432E9C|nr:hypothetical protein [Nostoc sp. XA010]MCC5662042.1 hypothetical protein [Nostoc sp. XA010]
MNAWSATANVPFVETNTDPQVRIARTQGKEYWSYLGTDILSISADQLTMNLDSSNQVIIYTDSEYQGFAQTLDPGKYHWGQIHNDIITVRSLKIPAGMKVTFYSDVNFGGESKTFTADTPYVSDDFNV